MKNRALQTTSLLAVALFSLLGCGNAGPLDDGALTGPQSQALAPDSGTATSFATTRDNKRIAYRVVGSGPQDIVLVHGWSVSGSVYDYLIPELASADYRLLVLDLRGSGESEQPDGGYSVQSYVEDIEAVVDHAGADDFALIGHSMGGLIVQKYAAMHSDRIDRLVLMAPAPASGFPLPPEIYDLFASSAYDLQLRELIFRASSANLDDTDLQLLMDSTATVSSKAVRQSVDAWVEADFGDMVSKIDAPTLVLVSDDPFFDAGLLQQLVVDAIGANASLEYFPGAGHYLQVEEPEKTAMAIDGFL